MTFKLPVALCQSFMTAINHDPDTWLYARLGLEQIQDAPGFGDEARARWALTDRSQAEPISEQILNMFRLVGRGNSMVTIDEVSVGLDAVIYTDVFHDSCIERWALIGEGAGGVKVEVNLAGFPDEDNQAA